MLRSHFPVKCDFFNKFSALYPTMILNRTTIHPTQWRLWKYSDCQLGEGWSCGEASSSSELPVGPCAAKSYSESRKKRTQEECPPSTTRSPKQVQMWAVEQEFPGHFQFERSREESTQSARRLLDMWRYFCKETFPNLKAKRDHMAACF